MIIASCSFVASCTEFYLQSVQVHPFLCVVGPLLGLLGAGLVTVLTCVSCCIGCYRYHMIKNMRENDSTMPRARRLQNHGNPRCHDNSNTRITSAPRTITNPHQTAPTPPSIAPPPATTHVQDSQLQDSQLQDSQLQEAPPPSYEMVMQNETQAPTPHQTVPIYIPPPTTPTPPPTAPTAPPTTPTPPPTAPTPPPTAPTPPPTAPTPPPTIPTPATT